jgi:hypothetical protein
MILLLENQRDFVGVELKVLVGEVLWPPNVSCAISVAGMLQRVK